jgi:hypothetical protein
LAVPKANEIIPYVNLLMEDSTYDEIILTQDIHDFFERLTENFYIEHRGKLRPAAMSILMVIFNQNNFFAK